MAKTLAIFAACREAEATSAGWQNGDFGKAFVPCAVYPPETSEVNEIHLGLTILLSATSEAYTVCCTKNSAIDLRSKFDTDIQVSEGKGDRTDPTIVTTSLMT